MAKNIINHIGTYNDHSKSITINGASTDVSSIVRSFFAEDVEPECPAETQQPSAEVWKKPKKGKYSEVRRYIEERKRGDAEFREYCAKHSLRELCTRLTEEFGWFVDEHSLGANLNRHI